MLSEIDKARSRVIVGSALRRWIVAGFIVVLGCLSCCVALAVTVCGSCGYELADTARFCSHCGAPVAETSAQNPVQQVPVESEGVVALPEPLISPDAVAEDMVRARKYLEQGQVDLARMFGRNALALNLLAGDDPDELRSKTILTFLDQCSNAAGRVRRKCLVCGGTGKRVMTANALNGSTHEVQVGAGFCECCGGNGFILGVETFDERKFRQGQADETYRTLQQSYGHQPVGCVWVPAEAIDSLKTVDRVTLKRALPPRCSHCAGFGRNDCKTCRGRGNVTCSAKGCEGGFVEREALGWKIGSGVSGNRNSIHRVKCESCGGTGLEPCKKCLGVGSFVCKACNGGGVGALCSKCSGTGLVTCKRCSGTGIYREKPCPNCKGEGVVECSSCGGTGRTQ